MESDFCDTQNIHQEKSSNHSCYTDTDVGELDETEMNELTAPSTENMLGNPHTDISNILMAFAPGEGKRPVFHEPLAEYLAFPTTYCGKPHPDNKDRVHPIQERDIFKYEL